MSKDSFFTLVCIFIAASLVAMFATLLHGSKRAKGDSPGTNAAEVLEETPFNANGNIYKVNYDGHTYIVLSEPRGAGILHDPDCGCGKEEEIEEENP